MKKVVKMSARKPDNQFESYIEEAWNLNKDLIATTFVKLHEQFSREEILSMYTEQLLSHALNGLNKEQIVKSVANGSLFSARESLYNRLNTVQWAVEEVV